MNDCFHVISSIDCLFQTEMLPKQVEHFFTTETSLQPMLLCVNSRFEWWNCGRRCGEFQQESSELCGEEGGAGMRFRKISVGGAYLRELPTSSYFYNKLGCGWFIIDQMQQANNIFIATISCLRSNAKVADLLHHFKDQLRFIKMRNVRLDPEAILKKYWTLIGKYERGTLPPRPRGWHENERKLFLWFLFAYYHLNFKKYSEISSKEWREFSQCFGRKDVLLLRYEAVALQRSSQRVYWSPPEEALLKDLIKGSVNGKWGDIARSLFFRSEGQHYKTSKQCREHWFNHLSTDIRKGAWTIEEDIAILTFVQTEGRHWSRLIDQIGRVRTEHMAKNRFGSLLHFARKYCNAASEVNGDDEKVLISSLIDYLNTHKALIYDNNPPSSPEQQCKSDKSISIDCPEVKQEAKPGEEQIGKLPTNNRLTEQSIQDSPESIQGHFEGAVNQRNYNVNQQENNNTNLQQKQQPNQKPLPFVQQYYNQNQQFINDHYMPGEQRMSEGQQMLIPQHQMVQGREALLQCEPQLVGTLGSPLLYTVTPHINYAFSTLQYHPPSCTFVQPLGMINYVLPFVAHPPQPPEQEEES